MKIAELKIYGDITSPEWIWSENDVAFHNVNNFLAANYDAEEIKLRIDCRGGDVDEGWKIYDALRTSGKIISAVIDGECSSMASIVLLAAAKERRTMKEHSFILIHNPYTFMFPEPQQAETLQTIADELFAERERFVDLYVERTNATREEIIDLMQKAGKINADEAKRLGFVSGIIPANTAKNNNNQTKKGMKLSFKVRAALVSALGGRVLGMELTTANGETLTVEREEGEIAVGDAATPDGEHTLPDGRVVVVSNGVITEIREAAPADDKDAEIERLKKEIADKDAEIERLKKELEDAKQTDDEKIIVEALKEIGVENIKAMASNAKMPRRNNNNKAGMSLREKINEKKGE